MSRRELHTHRGHCQCCGRVQAIERGPGVTVDRGKIAKHGYTTQWGYFSGTCAGSGKPALEFERVETDRMCRELLKYAITQDTWARKLRDRTAATPETLKRSVRVFDKHPATYEDVEIAWADATEHERTSWYESCLATAELNARSARRHRAFMRDLAVKVYGTPAQVVDRTARAVVEVGTEYELYNARWRVVSLFETGYRRRTAYARAERIGEQHVNAALNTATMRVQDVRKAIEGARA